MKYVILYPKDRHDAMTFVVYERKDGTFEFRVIVDEKKLGQQVTGFLLEAHPKTEKGRAPRCVEFSAALPRDKEGDSMRHSFWTGNSPSSPAASWRSPRFRATGRMCRAALS